MKTWRPTLPENTEFKMKQTVEMAKVGEFVFQIGEYAPLRQPSQSVDLSTLSSDEFKQKHAYLQDCFLRFREITGHGRGISAVQVGIPEQFAIIYTPEKLLTVINPKVTNVSEKKYKYCEMCMSTGLIISPVVRPTWIECEYYDEKGNRQLWNMKDDTDLGKILNRVFQHEIDHMNGVINIDHVASKDLLLETDPHFYDEVHFEEVSP